MKPLTNVTNKHLLPVYDEPMIYKVLKTLTKSGITDITIVLGGESVGETIRVLGDGSDFGANLSYVYQQKAGGIAEALYLCKTIVKTHKIAVILGDNMFQDTFEEDVKKFSREALGNGCKLFLKGVSMKDAKRFGVAEFDEKNNLIAIEEKPTMPKSLCAVTGLYFYDEYLFDYIEYQMEKFGYSERGELEITDLNNIYIEYRQVDYKIVNGWWTDAGTFDTLHLASNLVRATKNPRANLWTHENRKKFLCGNS